MGSEAARILHHDQTGRVIAVFKRSCYIQCQQGVVCIGLASLGQGPLHILLESIQDHLPKQITSGLPVNIGCGLRQCVDGDAPHCVRFAAEKNSMLFSGKILSKASNTLSLQLIQSVMEMLVPTEQHGFGWILGKADWRRKNVAVGGMIVGGMNAGGMSAGGMSEELGALDSSFRRQCFPALLCLSRWLEVYLDCDAEPYPDSSPSGNHDSLPDARRVAQMTEEASLQLPALLGAGPGLTPAGDDLLAGVMLALHRVDRAPLADLIWKQLEPQLVFRTNAISGAHLCLAAKGQCSETMLQLLELLFIESTHHEPDDAQSMAMDIQTLANRMGASSGWDSLAGMSLVLRAL